MAYTTALCFFVILVATSASQWLEKNQNSSEPIRPQIRLIVTVEGKSFFAEATPLKTWAQASSYCASMGMKSASISTNTQYLALIASYHQSNFNGEFWTSAKSVNTLTQFTWNSGTGEQPGSFLTYQQNRHNLSFNGLTFRIQQDKVGALHGNELSQTWGTLCETF